MRQKRSRSLAIVLFLIGFSGMLQVFVLVIGCNLFVRLRRAERGETRKIEGRNAVEGYQRPDSSSATHAQLQKPDHM